VVTIRQLLRDPIFRKYFATAPREVTINERRPWWIYLRSNGAWTRTKFESYKKAFGEARLLLADLDLDDDFAITSRGKQFWPPDEYQIPEGHLWCLYCRRPTIFRHFRRHHAFPTLHYEVSKEFARCSICGVSQQQGTIK
jgi:hypothetical protein